MRMAAVIPIRQSPFWAKRENQPPTCQRNDASRSREYLTPDKVERMIVAARRTDGTAVEHAVRCYGIISGRFKDFLERPTPDGAGTN
jgi:hypothetical protein